MSAFLLGLLLLYKRGAGIKLFSLYSLIILICILLGINLWDASYDGSWYHADLIHKLSYDSYNPYYDTWILKENELTAYHSSLWISCYAKGYEIIAATIVSLTGNLESGKTCPLFFALRMDRQ